MEAIKLIAALTVICVVAGFLLAGVMQVTKEPIEAARREETLQALRAVLPDYDNDPVADAREVATEAGSRKYYIARKNGAFAGAAFQAVSEEGYGGQIVMMVGVTAAKQVNAIRIVEHRETPGLGSKICTGEFRKQFEGKGASDTAWCRVKKDDPQRGTIDAITGATISSRAVTNATAAGLAASAKDFEEISKTGGE